MRTSFHQANKLETVSCNPTLVKKPDGDFLFLVLYLIYPICILNISKTTIKS